MKPVFDRRLAGLAPLVSATCARFRIRAPRAVRQVSRAHGRREGFKGRCHEDGTIELAPADQHPIPLATLAHELAHLKAWPHGPAHLLLTGRILDWWNTREVWPLLRRLPLRWRPR